eukprot:TRINITY_DN8701_c0_g1_i2.p2 TRINITY_DN8701_c0_g1~~TRINITY_DN8701_c0_g1_i2.p2  ORF type:complete len:224 (-),score=35.73 TRINITY_DN8701_c0_g1_i2:49-720(-)
MWDLDTHHMKQKTHSEMMSEILGLWKNQGFRLAVYCWLAKCASGLAMISMFFPLILKTYGVEEGAALRWFTLASVIKTIAIIPTVLLMDSFGRRFFFLLSAVACALFMSTAAYLSTNDFPGSMIALALTFYFCSYSLGYGPVPWVYCFEILPNELRGRAAVISPMPGDAFANILIVLAPLLLEADGVLLFTIVAASNLLAAGFFYTVCPETKAMLLEKTKEVI